MTDEEVGFRLALKNRREVQHGVNEVGDEFNRTGDQAERAGRKARIAAGGMLAFGRAGRIAGRAAIYGTGAVVAGVVGAGIVLTKLSKDSLAEAREAQKVGAVTRAEIRATGRAANVTAKQVGNLAGAISTKVGVDDEEIQAGANMILTFKNVRNEAGKGSKIFNRTTKDAVDLAKAGFGSITSQSKVLAKALNDPVKGLSALGKSGVTFTQQQQDQIKALVEQGDLLSAQKIILGEVEHQVGGVAAAQATWGDKASVSIGNIKERIGLILQPRLDQLERWFVTKGTPVVNDWIDVFEKRGIPMIGHYADLFERKAIPAIGDFYDEAKPVAESILPAIGDGFAATADAVKVIAPRMKSIFDGFNNLPDWAKQAIIIGAGGAAVGKKLGAFSLGKSILGGVTSAKPLPVYVVNNGVPGVPGKGTPIVPTSPGGPGAVPSLLGKGLPFVLRAGSLVALPLNNTDDKVHPNNHGIDYNNIGTEADLKRLTAEKNAYTEWWDSATKVTKGITAQTRGMIAGVDQVDNKVDKAKNSTQQWLNVLTGVDKTFGPKIDTSSLDAAIVRATDFQSRLAALAGETPTIPSAASGSPAGGHRHHKHGGQVAPRKAFPSVDQPSYGDDDFGPAGAAAPRIEIPVHVNGREVARAVYDDAEDKMARQ